MRITYTRPRMSVMGLQVQISVNIAQMHSRVQTINRCVKVNLLLINKNLNRNRCSCLTKTNNNLEIDVQTGSKNCMLSEKEELLLSGLELINRRVNKLQ